MTDMLSFFWFLGSLPDLEKNQIAAHFDIMMSATPFPPTSTVSVYPKTVLVKDDCLNVLRALETNSVALILIDPPYGAQTQGQQTWDKAWTLAFWTDILAHIFRVLIPGGHMIVFASGKTIYSIHGNIELAYKATKQSKKLSHFRNIWQHESRDSGRCHSHTPLSQFEDVLVYYREGEGKSMESKVAKRGEYDLQSLLCQRIHFRQVTKK